MSREIDVDATIRPAKFAHVVLRTRKLKEAVEWYGSVLGMEVVFGNDFASFLTYDEEHHRLALLMTPQEELAPPGAVGMDHVAYTFNKFGDLMQTYKRLKGIGILPVWCINHGPTTSLYYQDPDGNRVELQFDNFSTQEELKDFMTSGAFDANPIGVEFDPDRLLERYQNGDEIEELILQGSA